jgi:hypothetical protein
MYNINVPIIIGELGSFLEFHDNKCNYWTVINDSMRQLCTENSAFALASSQGLTHNGDTLHFNSSSLKKFGIRYSNAWQKFGIKLC